MKPYECELLDRSYPLGAEYGQNRTKSPFFFSLDRIRGGCHSCSMAKTGSEGKFLQSKGVPTGRFALDFCSGENSKFWILFHIHFW